MLGLTPMAELKSVYIARQLDWKATVASEDTVMQFAVACVCVMAYSRNKPPPPPAAPATSQPAPPPPPQPAVPPPVAAGVVGQQPQPPQQGPSAGPVGTEETDDTMKNLRKTFAGIFGNM